MTHELQQGAFDMIIDGHAHACGEFRDLAGVLGVLDRTGTDAVLLTAGQPGSRRTHTVLPWAEKKPDQDYFFGFNRVLKVITKLARPEAMLGEGNEIVYRMAQQAPSRIFQSLWVDPNAPDSLAKAVVRHREWKFRALKLHQCFHRFKVDGNFMLGAAEWAGKAGLPVIIHLYGPKDAESLLALAKNYPATNFITNHLIGLEIFQAGGTRPDNLFLDISCPPLVSVKRVESAIKWAGASGVTMGSDTPYGKDNLVKILERVRNLPIPAADRDLIMGGNLSKLLGIS